MPMNYVTAQSVLRVHYRQLAVNRGHTMVLYLDGQVIAQNDGTLTLFGITNPNTSADWTIHDIIAAIFSRSTVSLAIAVPAYQVALVEAWHNVPDSPTEVFVGFDLADYSDVVGGSATPVAGAIMTLNMQTAERLNWKMSFLDSGLPVPVRIIGTNPPDVDDGSIEWFLLKSNVPFANNDGVRITRFVSATTGLNDKLVRVYGRDWNTAVLF